MRALEGQKIGFIGLGLMGRPMTENLLSAGASVIGHNRSQQVVEDLATNGLTPAETPGDVAEAADTVILMLPDTETVESILLDKNGVIGGLQSQEQFFVRAEGAR